MRQLREYHVAFDSSLLESNKSWAWLCLVLIATGTSSPVRAQDRNALLEPGIFIQIPGPNPILTAGAPGSWDDKIIEAADILEDLGQYYLYYHGVGSAEDGYQLGVASSSHPLGPFVKHGDAPIVPKGTPGSWDDANTFCAVVVKVTQVEKDTKAKFYMLYGGTSRAGKADVPICDIGLATADNPLGPWEKSPKNPILKDFGYNGGLVERDGKWYLFNAWPISSAGGRDYSPMAVATAEKPEGPWTKYEGNPILDKGGWGEWDDGGFSEARVFSTGNFFHMFYGGAKPSHPRFASRESIGYAYSRDGLHWTKYDRNPVAQRQDNPNAAAFAEVRALWQSPFVYCYHTLRYEKPWRERDKQPFPDVEDLGVQVLVTQRPFALDMPVLERHELGPRQSSSLSLEETRCIALSNVTSASATVECKFDGAAKGGLRVHLRSSTDGKNYDSEDFQVFDVVARAGETARQTFHIMPNVRFLKAIVENLDESQPVKDIKVQATLRG